MLGAYIGVTVMRYVPNLWLAALAAGIAVALFGGLLERLILRKLGRLVNEVIQTYPNVSQFWKYKPEDFLKNPVYSRNWPPAKNLES